MKTHYIGVISDTHGLLRPGVAEALSGVELIIHAGDVGKPEVLEGLRAIAPVVAVQGNIDSGILAKVLHETETVDVDSTMIYVIHDLHEMNLNPKAAGFRIVVSGHSHQPDLSEKDGVTYLNPGSAGPRRFSLPVMLAKMTICGDQVQVDWVELE